MEKDGLDVAVEAALDLRAPVLLGEAELHLDVDVLETLLQVHVGYQAPLLAIVLV